MTTNLLNLNVDTLFEQHSVPEIDIIQKKIQGVVENKREELRTMVGERYRDLLAAADTIASMQNSAGSLITQIEEITANCREQQLLGFKNEADTTQQLRQRNANKELNNYFSTMIQIKLLTSLPEMIWSQIDQEHFYTATELFIFSRHISTGLQLDANNEIMRQLPVAKKQWEILKPFHTTIKQHLMTTLEREDLSAEVAADCLMSLLLLEKNSLNGVVKSFLQLRSATYSTCLSHTVKSGEIEMRRVKERILASLRVLNGTVLLLSKCLLENGLLSKKLSYIENEAPLTITLTDGAQYAHLLPEIIANFRPKFDLQPLERGQAAASIEQWLEDTKRMASVQLKQLFNLVADMTSIQDIKLQANVYKKELDLAEMVTYFDLKHTLDFYDTYYVPLINQRVRDIIEHSWAQAITTMFQAIEQSLANEALAVENIWLEQTNDLPASLELALSDDQKLKKLLMRTKGYDANILKICETFDKQLGAIVAEMNVLLEEQNAKSSDKLALIEFLRDIAERQLTDLLNKLKGLNLGKAHRRELIFVARSCVALIELCPQLKICFCQQTSWRQYISSSSNQTATSLEHWKNICLLFEQQILDFWSVILDSILAEHNCQLLMPTELSHVVLLEDFVLWETITLEQKDEQDVQITSSFRIPNQPRISLQTYLFNLMHILNSAVPQTLPQKVLTIFNQNLLSHLLVHYEALSNLTTLATNQSIALQLYFDLKFLQASFNMSRDNRTLADQFQKLQNTFKDIIDPFDFELFAQNVSQNVKRAVSRLNFLLPSDNQVSGGSVVTTSITQEKDPNVLCLSTSASSAWFPLLPIVKSDTNKNQAAYTETDKQQISTTSSMSTTTPTRKTTSRKGNNNSSSNNDTNQKSKTGATSFFGAMSQEWFR